jgi:hypothetical protein
MGNSSQGFINLMLFVPLNIYFHAQTEKSRTHCEMKYFMTITHAIPPHLVFKAWPLFERAEYFISFQAIPHKKCGCAAFIFNEKVTLKLLCINQRLVI